MHVPSQISPTRHGPARCRNQIGLIKRLSVPNRGGHKVEVSLVLNIRIAANPGGVDLSGNEQCRNLLIGSPRDQFDGGRRALLLGRPQMTKQLEVVRQEDRRKPELEWLVLPPGC